MFELWRAVAEPVDLPMTVDSTLVPLVDGTTKEESAPAHPIVSELDSRLFPLRRQLVSWSIVDGIILLHQGGGAITAIPAYADDCELLEANGGSQRQKPLWTIAERSVFPAPELWRIPESSNYNPEFERPFAPVVTSDHRFAIFSAPYGVAVLPLAALPGWSVDANAKPITRIKYGLNSDPEWTVAAPPVVLESHQFDGSVEASVGVLLAHRRNSVSGSPQACQYHWHVFDLSKEGLFEDALTSQQSPQTQGLNIDGPYCQLIRVTGKRSKSTTGLLFATPRGIWVAAIEYANRHSPPAVAQLKSEQLGRKSKSLEGLSLNADVESRNRFRWDRLLLNPAVESVDDANMVMWCASQRESRDTIYEMLSFSWPKSRNFDPAAGIPVSIIEVSNSPSIPVGIARRAGISRAFFLSAERGELFSHQIGEHGTTEHRAFLTHIEQLTGIALFDPLIIAIRRTPNDRKSSELEDYLLVRSLKSPEVPLLRYGPFRLESDPLYWNNAIYITERVADRLVVRRIELPAVSRSAA